VPGDPAVSGGDGESAKTRFSDSLTVRFHGSGPAIGMADGAVTDCIGNPVPEGADLAARSVKAWGPRAAPALRSVVGSS
jgi:hypothetical protein